jgi:hypothetical protein
MAAMLSRQKNRDKRVILEFGGAGSLTQPVFFGTHNEFSD